MLKASRTQTVGHSSDNTSSFSSHDFAIARYNSNGSPDVNFGFGGKVTTNFFGNLDEANAVAIQDNGRVIAAGLTRPSDTTLDIALAAYVLASDFALGLAPGPVVAERGTRSAAAVSIIRTGGFAGNVTITPPDTTGIGVKVKPPEPITSDGPSVRFKLKIKAGATLGTHQLIFTGRDENGRLRSATLSLTVQ